MAMTSRLQIASPSPLPPKLARGRAVRLDEGVEQLGLLLGRDADTGIGDLEFQPDRLVPVGQLPHLEGHAALGRELEPVADQIDQHLPQPGRVAPHRRHDSAVDRDPQLEPALGRLRRQQRAHLLDHIGQGEVDPLQLAAARPRSARSRECR